MWPFDPNPPETPWYHVVRPVIPVPDTRTTDCFAISGVWQILPFLFTISYLFIYGNNRSRRMLVRRFNRETVEKCINWIGFLGNLIISLGLTYYMYMSNYSWICQPVSQSGYEDKIAEYMYWFMIMKYFEFGDSLVLALRITNDPDMEFDQDWKLHLFHHAVVSLMSWLCVKYLPGGSAAIMAFLNSMAHCLYYSNLTRQINRAVDSTVCRIKYFLTGHIILILTHCLTSLFKNCGFPIYANLSLLIFTTILIYFGDQDQIYGLCNCFGGNGGGGGNGGHPSNRPARRDPRRGGGGNGPRGGGWKKDEGPDGPGGSEFGPMTSGVIAESTKKNTVGYVSTQRKHRANIFFPVPIPLVPISSR